LSKVVEHNEFGRFLPVHPRTSIGVHVR
jgi:hypothetical protein